MRLQTALVAATSIAGTSAFLITPDIADAVTEAKHSLSELIFGVPQSLDVKCHQCPLFVADTHKDDANRETNGISYEVSYDKVDTTLHLEFTNQAGTLQINNETVFPLEAVNNKFPRLTVHQTRRDTGEELVTVPIDFVLASQQASRPRGHPHRFGIVKEDEHELITVDFTVIGMAGIPIKSQTAHADLIVHGGVVYLARLRAAEFNPTAPGENDLEVCKAARNIQLCRIRLMANRKLREMMQGALDRAKGFKEWMKTHGPGNKPRPCHKFHPGRIGTTMTDSHRFRHGQHGEHGHRHRHHRYFHTLMLIVKGLIVPAVAGFAFGFTVSAVGMLVGRFIVFLWTRFYRGGRAARPSHIEIVIEEGEKQGLMVSAEEPPAYEYSDEAPVYIVTEVKEQTQE